MIQQAGSTQPATRVIEALLRCQPLADRCAAMSGGGDGRAALTAVAQQFGTVCDEVVHAVAGTDLRPASPLTGAGEASPAHCDDDDDNMDSEEVRAILGRSIVACVNVKHEDFLKTAGHCVRSTRDCAPVCSRTGSGVTSSRAQYGR